jgi:hypothetical protein
VLVQIQLSLVEEFVTEIAEEVLLLDTEEMSVREESGGIYIASFPSDIDVSGQGLGSFEGGFQKRIGRISCLSQQARIQRYGNYS